MRDWRARSSEKKAAAASGNPAPREPITRPGITLHADEKMQIEANILAEVLQMDSGQRCPHDGAKANKGRRAWPRAFCSGAERRWSPVVRPAQPPSRK